MLLAQMQQLLHVIMNLLLIGGAPSGSKCVAWIAGEAARKIMAVVRIAASRHANLISVVKLRNPAHGEDKRESCLQFLVRRPFFAHKADCIVVPQKRD